jgi:ActR/RegA family two-component response regulator
MRWVKSFLIVTRNLDVQDVYVLQMRSQRVSAFGVDTWEEAIRVCRLTPFGAVLFDVEYHHDWESVALLRQGLPQDVPIVVLSGWLAVDRTYRNLARTLGCAGFVAKPASSDLVTRALARAAQGTAWSEYVHRYA